MAYLIFVTNQYPFGTWESHITHEMPHLAATYEKIFILPMAPTGARKPMPANCEVVGYKFTWRALRWLPLVVIDAARQLVRDRANVHLRRSPLKYLRSALGGTVRAAGRVDWMLRVIRSIPSDAELVIYHHWMTLAIWYSELALRWSRRRGVRFSRALGYELYWNRSIIPFRRGTIARLGVVFTASDDGAAHLRQVLPHLQEKFIFGPLAVPLPALESPLPGPGGPLRIVSIAFIRPIKRIRLILDALRLVKRPVVWWHIGDGPEQTALEEAARELPAGITVRFLGYKTNEEVGVILQENSFHALVSVSETEGFPISMMEAMSYGIPVIATAVGGVPQQIAEGGGLLLPKHPTPEEVAACLESYATDFTEHLGRRAAARSIMRERWAPEVVYPQQTAIVSALPSSN